MFHPTWSAIALDSFKISPKQTSIQRGHLKTIVYESRATIYNLIVTRNKAKRC